MIIIFSFSFALVLLRFVTTNFHHYDLKHNMKNKKIKTIKEDVISGVFTFTKISPSTVTYSPNGFDS